MPSLFTMPGAQAYILKNDTSMAAQQLNRPSLISNKILHSQRIIIMEPRASIMAI
jgi:hypothetical protein